MQYRMRRTAREGKQKSNVILMNARIGHRKKHLSIPVWMVCFCYSFVCLGQKTGIGTLTPTNQLSVVGNADFMGNVGLGIAAPTKKLHVNGEALINSLTVGLGGNPSQVFNTAFGYNALASNSTGNQNTSVGYLNMFANSTGGDNTASGAYSLGSNTAGNGNTAIGLNALQLNISGSSNTAIGYQAGVGASNLTNASAIGANASVTASNCLILGNEAKVGIGTGTPATALEVVGNTRTTNLRITSGASNDKILKSDATGNASWVDIATLETDPQIGAMTTNQIPRWNGTNLSAGLLHDNGTAIGLGTLSPVAKLDVINPVNGIRLWSGGTGASNYTSFQIGRVATEGTLGVAATSGNFAGGSAPGDVILRTELATQRLIVNSGSGQATLVVNNSKVGMGTTTPVNKLDIKGEAAIGSTYSGTTTSPDNGVIIQENVGIRTFEPNGRLHVVAPTNKTNTDQTHCAFFTTNEPLNSNPFGFRISLTGGGSLPARSADLQTTDVNIADGGTLSLQPNAGYVGIGTSTPTTQLDVEGGIRTKYSGSVVFLVAVIPFPYVTVQYNVDFSPALPPDWNYTNTVLLVQNTDGIWGDICQAKLVDSDTMELEIAAQSIGNMRVNWIAFKL